MSFYDDASWLLVPSGIEEDVVFAQKPTSGLGDLTFTRASDATYTDSTGVVRRSPYNLVQFSEQFDNAYWPKPSGTISVNVTTAPNGTITADKYIVNNGQTTNSPILSTFVFNTNTAYTLSLYVKKADYDTASIRLYTDQTGFSTCSFNLANGTASGGTISALSNSWFRVSVSFTTASTVTNGQFQLIRDAQIRDGVAGIFIWGAQLVEGTSAIDYFPTTNRQDVPRIDFRNADGTLSSCGRLLLEPQRTNSIRNSSMVGAVAGSPGTLPTNWTQLFGTGLTRTLVGTGTENGLPYVDVRFNGTVTTISTEISTETASAISVSNGQVWSNSAFIKIISAPIPPNSYSLKSYYWNGGAYVSESNTSFTPTTTLTRYLTAHTVPSGTITHISQSIRMNLTNGAAYDFTIRIAAPQMELGAYATTWVPTTTAAVTRLADSASKTGVSSLIGQTEGTIFIEINKTQNGYNYYSISDGTNNNWIFVGLDADSPNLIRAYVRTVTGITADIKSGVIANGTVKMAIAYKLNDVVLYVNGTQIGTDTSAAMPTGLSGIYLTGNVSSTTVTNAVNQAALFPTRLTNAQLAELTTL